MSKKKGTGIDKAAERELDKILQGMGNLSPAEREIMKQTIINAMSEKVDTNDPNSLNMHFYDFDKTPDKYNHGSKRVPQWLKQIWDTDYEFDWIDLCEETAEKGKDLSDEKRSKDVKKYLCLLVDDFYDRQDIEPDLIRLLGVLWLIEHYHLTDCLDMVIELLRQDAWFFTAYIEHSPHSFSAVLYQIGYEHTVKLRDMLYEMGLIPHVKPIVFNALIWTAIRKPQKRLATVAMILEYLNYCLKICKEGASAMNISQYAHALAYAHIDEARPLLKRLFSEVKGLSMETFREVESIYDDPDDGLEDLIYDSVDEYVRFYELDNVDFYDPDIDENWDDDEEESFGIYDYKKQQKRYTVRIELLDGPTEIMRTLQVPSNIRLRPFVQLVMLAYGRKDVPEDYTLQVRNELYYGSSTGFVLADLLKKKRETAWFNIYDKPHGVHWRHGLVLENSSDYSERTTNYMVLLDGRGTYPPKSIIDMDEYCQRFLDGKLREPNFKTVRQNIRDFEDENMIM